MDVQLAAPPAGPTTRLPPAVRRHHLLLAATLAAVALGLALELATGGGRMLNPFLPVIVLAALLNGVLGYLVARRHAGHPVGRVLAAAGLAGAVTVLAGGHANAALFGPLPDAGATWSLWVNRWLWAPTLVLGTTVLMLVFPDGRLPTARWRPAVWVALAGGAAFTLLAMTTPFDESAWSEVPVTNPVGVGSEQVRSIAWPVASLTFVGGTAVGSAAVVARFRRASAQERARIGLVVVPAVLVPPALLASQVAGDVGAVAEMAAGSALVVAVTVSMLRHRILDLDVVVNRAVVYALLTAFLVGVYVAVVALVAAVVGSRSSWLPGIVAAGVVAASFSPLLHHFTAGVSRLLYGDRARPDLVVNRLAEGTSDDVLATSAEAVRVALRAPWVRLRVGDEQVRSGEPRTAGHDVPLRHRDEPVGTLAVGARWDSERLSRADRRVLDAVARQLAATAHAVLLARRLSAARERLVAAREDERRRIRRDLHDGLGPALAGITLGLEGAEAMADRDPGAALALLADLRTQSVAAVSDVRRLVDGLRPPTLDTLGLAGTLRQELGRLSTGGPCAELRAPADLPELPAATEVAALRIALEALHNVRRHARATTCVVELAAVPAGLLVRVQDDGAGIAADAEVHVGLTSMRERAEEIGGTLTITHLAPGTQVEAVLPSRAR